jgi:hypothetical protein
MDGSGFIVLGLALIGGAAYYRWLLRERPEDRSAIDFFAEQRGLRVISVERTSKFFRYWFRGFNLSSVARIYVVTVEDFEGSRADVHVVFDPWTLDALFGSVDDAWFGSPELEVLKPRGLALAAPGQPVSLTENASATPRVRWNWHERLAALVIGACMGGFIFCGILHTNLSPPARPLHPEPALGYTYLLATKHGVAYGTLFEHLAVTYGI